jgi:hypothetical protein
MQNISRIEVLISGMDQLVNAAIERRHEPSTYRAGIGSSLLWSAGMQLFNALRIQREVYDNYATLISLKRELDEKLPEAERADKAVEFAESLLAWARGFEVSPEISPDAEALLTLALSDNPPQDLVPPDDVVTRKARVLEMSEDRVRADMAAVRAKDNARQLTQTQAAQKFAALDYDGLRRQLQSALDKAFCDDKFDLSAMQAVKLTAKLVSKFKIYMQRAKEAAYMSEIEYEETQHAANRKILLKLIGEAAELMQNFEVRVSSETGSMFEPAEPGREDMAPGRQRDAMHEGAQLSPSAFAALQAKLASA